MFLGSKDLLKKGIWMSRERMRNITPQKNLKKYPLKIACWKMNSPSQNGHCFRVGTSPPFVILDLWSLDFYVIQSKLGKNMDVSKNRGTPKWMVYNGKPYYNGWFGGTRYHYFWKHPYEKLGGLPVPGGFAKINVSNGDTKENKARDPISFYWLFHAIHTNSRAHLTNVHNIY